MALTGKTLTVYLAADLKKFTGPLATAKTQLGMFDGGLAGMTNRLNNWVGPAMIGAGAAAAGLAVKLGVDGVQAAADDEAAMARLSKQLDNMGYGYLTDSIVANIDAMQRQYGVSEDQLRPAFARLLRSTQDATQAQSLLSLAMDVSAGTGKSLESTVAALGKAADGSFGAIGKLGVGIDKATLKTADLDTITGILSDKFGGSAQAAANTYKGKLDRLTIAAGELQEAFGTGFLEAFTTSLGDTDTATGDLTQQMKDLEPSIQLVGAAVGVLAGGMIELAKAEQNALKWLFQFGTIADTAAYTGLQALVTLIPGGNLVLGALAWNLATASQSADSTANSTNRLTSEFDKNLMSGQRFHNQLSLNAVALDTQEKKTKTATSATKELTDQQQAFIDRVDKQTEALDKQSGVLSRYAGEVENWGKQITQFVQGIQSDILKSFDLTSVFEAALGAGTDFGSTFRAGVEAEAAQTEWTGNVLKHIQEQGSAELRDYLVKVGGENAAAWGQALITNGLVKYMADKLGEVQAQAKVTAEAMVPEFMTAGYTSGLQAMAQTAQAISDQRESLAKIGAKAGKVLGKSLAAEVAKEIADAIAAAEEAGSAARQRAVAQETARQTAITQQTIANLVGKVVSDANARSGYNAQPVVA